MAPTEYSKKNRLYWKAAPYLPEKLLQAIKRIYSDNKEGLRDTIEYLGLSKPEEEPTKVQEIEYDNLIIIDACRHDLYTETINEDADYIISPASRSEEFIYKTFNNTDFQEHVLINANAFNLPPKYQEIHGRQTSEDFHTVFQTILENWNKELGTTEPEMVRKNAETAEKLYPDKKKIIWFIQPHIPFINSSLTEKGKEIGDSKENNIWTQAKKGELKHSDIWPEYRENLEIVMKEVEKLVENLEGRTVLISDHGNLVGEAGLYGKSLYDHPPFVNSKALKKVPFEVLQEE